MLMESAKKFCQEKGSVILPTFSRDKKKINIFFFINKQKSICCIPMLNLSEVIVKIFRN